MTDAPPVFSAGDIDRFTPDAKQGQEGAPVYLIAPLGIRDRARFRAQLAAEGVRFPSNGEFVAALRAVIAEVAPDNAPELLASLQEWEEFEQIPLRDLPDDATDEDRAARAEDLARRIASGQAFDRLLDTLRQHQAIGQLLKLRSLFNQLIGPIAAAYGLRGWENVKAPFRRVNNVVPDDLLDRLPPDDLDAIGSRALVLQSLTDAQRGN